MVLKDHIQRDSHSAVEHTEVLYEIVDHFKKLTKTFRPKMSEEAEYVARYSNPAVNQLINSMLEDTRLLQDEWNKLWVCNFFACNTICNDLS